MRKSDEDLTRVRRYLEEARLSEQQKLPPERELAEILDLTRNRLRGALRKLSGEGLIWREVGRGTFFGQRPLADSSGRGYNLGELTNPREVMEARMVFEPELARVAALRAKRADLDEMATCIQKMEASVDSTDWAFWDARFHRAIAHAAHNTLMEVMLETIQANLHKEVWGGLVDRHSPPNRQEGMRHHRELFEALRNRNADEAFKVMRAHLSYVRGVFFND